MPEKQARSPIESDFRKRLPQKYRGQRRDGRGEAIRDRADGAVRLPVRGAGCSFAAAVVRGILAWKYRVAVDDGPRILVLGWIAVLAHRHDRRTTTCFKGEPLGDRARVVSFVARSVNETLGDTD